MTAMRRLAAYLLSLLVADDPNPELSRLDFMDGLGRVEAYLDVISPALSPEARAFAERAVKR